jgi:transposase
MLFASRSSGKALCRTSRQSAPGVGKSYFSPMLCRDRNAIECMFCRLEDYRRISARCEKLSANFFGAVCLAATVSYWL